MGLTAEEKILKIMQEQGKVHNPSKLQLAEMISPTECKIGDLKLEKDDLYVPERLKKKMCYGVNFTKNEASYVSALAAGDLVVICRINDEKYVILEKVVSM